MRRPNGPLSDSSDSSAVSWCDFRLDHSVVRRCRRTKGDFASALRSSLLAMVGVSVVVWDTRLPSSVVVSTATDDRSAPVLLSSVADILTATVGDYLLIDMWLLNGNLASIT
jgi:hypothetical protein